MVQYERGLDRICDLELLEGTTYHVGYDSQQETDARTPYLMAHQQFHQCDPIRRQIKISKLDHVWEKFTVSLQIADPLELPGTTMSLLTNTPKVGNREMKKMLPHMN